MAGSEPVLRVGRYWAFPPVTYDLRKWMLSCAARGNSNLTLNVSYFSSFSFDAGKNFELAVDFFDLLEGIIQVEIWDPIVSTEASFNDFVLVGKWKLFVHITPHVAQALWLWWSSVWKRCPDRGSSCRVELGVEGYLKKVEHFGLPQ